MWSHLRLILIACWISIWYIDLNYATKSNAIETLPPNEEKLDNNIQRISEFKKILKKEINRGHEFLKNVSDAGDRKKIADKVDDLKKTLRNILEQNVALIQSDDLSIIGGESESFQENMAMLVERENALHINYKAVTSDLEPTTPISDEARTDEPETITGSPKCKGGFIKDMNHDIVHEIKRSKFNNVEYLLAQDNKFKKEIPRYVKEVFEHSAHNFPLLLNLTQSLTTTTVTYHFLRAIYDFLIEHKADNPSQFIQLAATIQSQLLEQTNLTPDIKEKAKKLYDEVIESIKSTVPKVLARAMALNKYLIALKLAEEVFMLSQEASDGMMRDLIDVTYGVIPTQRIIENLARHIPVSQQVVGITALYWRLRNETVLDSAAILMIASELYRLGGERLDDEKRNDITMVVADLPSCARNLFFEKMVCLWNVGTQEYLFAEESEDDEKRKVYTWWPGKALEGSLWYTKLIGSQVYFKNHHQHHEFLYPNTTYYKADMRYVMTWFTGKKPKKEAAWDVVLFDDYCYMKSAHYNEYMFASSLIDMEDRRYVFTRAPPTNNPGKEYQWEMRTCDDVVFLE